MNDQVAVDTTAQTTNNEIASTAPATHGGDENLEQTFAKNESPVASEVALSSEAEVSTSTHANEGDTICERPEWLPEKFKDAEALAKSYGELEKRFGGFTGAPKEYEFTPSEALADSGFEYDSSDPDYARLTEIGKKLNMSNDAFNEFVNFSQEAMARETQEFREAYQEEMTAYTDSQIQSLNQSEIDLFKTNMQILANNPDVDEKAANSFLDSIHSADHIRFLNMAMGQNQNVSSVPANPSAVHDTRQSLREANAQVGKMPNGPAREAAKRDLMRRYQALDDRGLL